MAEWRHRRIHRDRAIPPNAPAAQLVVEDATFEAEVGDTFVLPVALQGGQNSNIGALNFSLLYDPDVLEVVGVRAGRAALETNKQVQGNVIQPGELAVICIGMIQNALPDGVLAEVAAKSRSASN